MNIFKHTFIKVLDRFSGPYIDLSVDDSNAMWECYVNYKSNGKYQFGYITMSDYIKKHYKGICDVAWITDPTNNNDMIRLTFTEEKYKTWFSLNWEWR